MSHAFRDGFSEDEILKGDNHIILSLRLVKHMDTFPCFKKNETNLSNIYGEKISLQNSKVLVKILENVCIQYGKLVDLFRIYLYSWTILDNRVRSCSDELGKNTSWTDNMIGFNNLKDVKMIICTNVFVLIIR